MKFILKFIPVDKNGSRILFNLKTIVLPSINPGLKILNKIKKQANVSFLDLEKIDECFLSCFESSTRIVLTEEQAIETGLFEEEGFVEIEVIEKGLNKYVERSFKINKDKKNEILHINLERSLNEKKLYNDWKAAGFPKRWIFALEEK
jgi:hypothetical protein